MTDPIPHSISRFTQKNRRAWNEIASIRAAAFPPAAFFANGGSILDARAVAAAEKAFHRPAGRLDGLRVLHLQCSTGEDTLSWSVLGADAEGLDISEDQIAIARKKAAEAGLPVTFHAADIYSPPQELAGSFDLIFTGGGALVWLPELSRWAGVVVSLLRTGGRLLLIDTHPLAACLSVDNGHLKIEDDYFRRGNPWEGTGWAHFSGGENAREIKYEFNWPIGDVVTALAAAGLVIERLDEFPGGEEWRFGKEQGDVLHIPGQFLLLARKP